MEAQLASFWFSMPWTHAWSCAGTLLKLAAYLRQLTCSVAIAQLGERIVRNDEVVGSIPTSSTNLILKTSKFYSV